MSRGVAGALVRVNGAWVRSLDQALTNEVLFNPTAAEQTWVVPAGVTTIEYEVAGAGAIGETRYSGGGIYSGRGGKGAVITGSLSVTPGETLYIYVGGGPRASGPGNHLGGWPDGGNGSSDGADDYGAGGGGSTSIRQGGNANGNRVVVAAGGGGGGNRGNYGGNGGDPTGYNGKDANGNDQGSGGRGATTGAGGTIGGAYAQGGASDAGTGNQRCGGGGGGLYGGGGGSNGGGLCGSGGGGSSLVPGGAICYVNSVLENGYAIIRY